MSGMRAAETLTVARRARAGADRLWRTISTPGCLERCHPFCERNPVRRWPGPGSEDTIHYYGGRIVRRRFAAWLEGTGYDLVVSDPAGVEQALVGWRIEPEGDGACRLTIRLVPSFVESLPAVLRRGPGRLVVRRRMRRYLESVVAGVVYHVETGERVVRNQFGPHPWFSPKQEPARHAGRGSPAC